MKEEGYDVISIPLADPNDFRGPTREWRLNDGKSITAFVRKAGVKFGGHFHKGVDSSKNPERIFLIDGIMKFRFLTPEGKITETTFKPGDVITIYPNVKHWVEAEGDKDVVFVEFRLNYFDSQNSDTYPC